LCFFVFNPQPGAKFIQQQLVELGLGFSIELVDVIAELQQAGFLGQVWIG